jgi:Na+/H+ antiporter NhaD/arsenite permease-like protein
MDRIRRHAATLGRFAREQVLEVTAGAIAAAFMISGRVTPIAALHAIDVDLLLVLFALLITVEILRESGYLDLAVAATVSRFTSTRTFAVALVIATGVLASFVTNDVTLFVVIPFTVLASRMSSFELENIVVLEIIASNLLGCLTPLGNPQNLFVFHRSGWSAGQFVMTMLPFVGVCAIGLVIALFLATESKPMTSPRTVLPPRDSKLAIAGAICFVLVLLEIARVTNGWPAAIAAAMCAVMFLRSRIRDLDLSIIPLFFFAFIAVEGLRTFDLPHIANIYVSAALISQVISNVPATILLSPFAAHDWRTLLYGVNAGGCGTIIASLANLLGWRIYSRDANADRRFFRRLTAFNFAFLVWAGVGGWVLLKVF